MNVTNCQPNYNTGAIGYKKQNAPAFGVKIGNVPLDKMERIFSEETFNAVKDSLPALREQYNDDITLSLQVGKVLRKYVKLIVEERFGKLRLASGDIETHEASKGLTLKGKNITTENIVNGVETLIDKLSKVGEKI